MQLVSAGTSYSYYCYGNCSSSINDVTTYGGIFLQGGSTEVDEAFKLFVQLAGGGQILVLRASGSDGYNKYIYELEKCHSVATIVFNSAVASSDSFVIGKIRTASGIFLAGGDQGVYLRYWQNSPVQTELQNAFQRNIPIGGTSAGMAVLSQFIYSAFVGSVTSAQALTNPYNQDMTFGQDFLDIPILNNSITDTHFQQRDRMGRNLAFISRIIKNYGGKNTRGIAADESVGVVIRGNLGTVYTQYPNDKLGNLLYLLEASEAPLVCEPNRPLSIRNIAVYKLRNGDLFDFSSWKPLNSNIQPYYLTVTNGVITSTQQGGNVY